MAICEDAPCCGCCGPAVWAADARAEEDAAWDRLNDPDAWMDDPDAWDDDEDEGDDPDAYRVAEDAGMEAGLVGWDA